MEFGTNGGPKMTWTKMNRRETVQSLGSGFVGLSSVPLLDPIQMTEIVVTRDNDGPVRTERVPTEWWESNLKARRIAENLAQKYSNRDSVTVTRTGGNREIGDFQVPIIEIEVSDESQTLDEPNNIDGVKVRTVSVDFETFERGCDYSGCYNKGPYDPARGGVMMGTSSGCYATSCFKATKDGTSGMLHAKHVWENCDNLGGENVLQNGQYCGEIVDHSYMRDWVLIDWDSDGDLENGYISGIRRSDQHRTAEICSYHDESGMETLACKSTAPDAYKQGVTTGVKSGQINKILEDDGLGFACAHSTKAFRARIDGAKGDSGGPVFTECPNDYLKLELCGMANVVQATVGDTACNGNTIYFNTKGFPTWELVQKDSINPVTA